MKTTATIAWGSGQQEQVKMMHMQRLIQKMSTAVRIFVWAGLLIWCSASSRADTWVSAPPMPTARSLAAAASPDGKTIYVIGGADSVFGPHGLNTVEGYNASTNRWSIGNPMPTSRYGLAAATDFSGKIYAMGGTDSIASS